MASDFNVNTVRYLVRFTGHVQGVGFRATTVAQSRGLAVHGFVRNESDGSVELDVDGPESDVKELIRRVKESMHDFLDEVKIDVLPPLGHKGGLRVRY
jgi:acylphosphatase